MSNSFVKPLPRTFTFTDPEKIKELARRGEAWGWLSDHPQVSWGF